MFDNLIRSFGPTTRLLFTACRGPTASQRNVHRPPLPPKLAFWHHLEVRKGWSWPRISLGDGHVISSFLLVSRCSLLPKMEPLLTIWIFTVSLLPSRPRQTVFKHSFFFFCNALNYQTKCETRVSMATQSRNGLDWRHLQSRLIYIYPKYKFRISRSKIWEFEHCCRTHLFKVPSRARSEACGRYWRPQSAHENYIRNY